MLNYLLGILTGFVYVVLACWLSSRFEFTIRTHDKSDLVTPNPTPNTKVVLRMLHLNRTIK